MGERVKIDAPADHVLRATLDNPPVNTLGSRARTELAALIARVADEPDIRCLILTGAGPNFCAGADLREEHDVEAEEAPDFFGQFGVVLTGFAHMRVPVIAAVNGPCLGGGLELALSCDLRLAASSARFVASGVNVGLVASFYSLTRALGSSRAASMLLTGLACDAAKAERFGLVSDVFADEELQEGALRLAKRIASRPPLSVATTKRCIRKVPDLDQHAALELQATEVLKLAATQDHKEALLAFLEKRPGRYSGR